MKLLEILNLVFQKFQEGIELSNLVQYISYEVIPHSNVSYLVYGGMLAKNRKGSLLLSMYLKVMRN